MAETDCIFCKIVAGDLPATVVHEDDRTVAFMDLNPATRGHLLVVPRTHAADVFAIDPEDLAAVARTGQVLARRLKERFGAAGVNLLNSSGAAAWQTGSHFHLHVIPRYENATLRLPWSPSPGEPDKIAVPGRELSP